MHIDFNHIYMCTNYTDLRKGIDGYAGIIQGSFHMNVMDKSLYIFCNRSRNKIKCLYWDGTGFWLFYKRLEKGHFKWERSENDEAFQISEQQLRWLLEGLKITQKNAIKEVKKSYI